MDFQHTSQKFYLFSNSYPATKQLKEYKIFHHIRRKERVQHHPVWLFGMIYYWNNFSTQRASWKKGVIHCLTYESKKWKEIYCKETSKKWLQKFFNLQHIFAPFASFLAAKHYEWKLFIDSLTKWKLFFLKFIATMWLNMMKKL